MEAGTAADALGAIATAESMLMTRMAAMHATRGLASFLAVKVCNVLANFGVFILSLSS
jgi:hypothetical protein